MPLRVAEKASYKLVWRKIAPQQPSSGELPPIEQQNPHERVWRGVGGGTGPVLPHMELQYGFIQVSRTKMVFSR